MLTPSKETSCELHLLILPDDPAMNVVTAMFQKLRKITEAEDGPEVISKVPTAGPSNLIRHGVISEAVINLSQTKLAHLISSTLTTSNDTMPSTITQMIFLPRPSSLFSIKPKTETKILLLATL